MINPDNTLYCYIKGGVELFTPSYSVAYTRKDPNSTIYIVHKNIKTIFEIEVLDLEPKESHETL
jgi:hypothetical protein